MNADDMPTVGVALLVAGCGFTALAQVLVACALDRRKRPLREENA